LLVAVLSLITEVSLGLAQRALTPRGLRSELVTARAAAVAATTIPDGKVGS